MKKTIITYSFDDMGEIYLDCHYVFEAYDPAFVKTVMRVDPDLELFSEMKEIASIINSIELRKRCHNSRSIILEGEFSREECDSFLKTIPREKLRYISAP